MAKGNLIDWHGDVLQCFIIFIEVLKLFHVL